MTFDDDFMLLHPGHVYALLKKNGMTWPPPVALVVGEGENAKIYRRTRFSEITDEQRQGMTHVCRGAEYCLDIDAKVDDYSGDTSRIACICTSGAPRLMIDVLHELLPKTASPRSDCRKGRDRKVRH